MSDAVFDGHNDVLLRLYLARNSDPAGNFLEGEEGHITLGKARAGNLAGGLFAVFCPSPMRHDLRVMSGPRYDLPLPDPLDPGMARDMTFTQVALLHRLVAQSQGAIALCTNTGEIRAAMAKGALAAMLHLEGAEAIDEDFYVLDVLYAAGLRSLGPVWSRSNIFGHGVPFRFPAGPDIGEGLTPAGKALVGACNQRRILIDLSHMSEKGFWDVAALTDAPLVASHSNVHAISASPRNLTDRQLDAIAESGGLVGLNFATSFLREDGQMRSDTDIEWMVRHLDALIERLGENGVALGSDFDGAAIPESIGSAAGLPVLFEHLRRYGYGEELIARIARENWLSMLERTVG